MLEPANQTQLSKFYALNFLFEFPCPSFIIIKALSWRKYQMKVEPNMGCSDGVILLYPVSIKVCFLDIFFCFWNRNYSLKEKGKLFSPFGRKRNQIKNNSPKIFSPSYFHQSWGIWGKASGEPKQLYTLQSNFQYTRLSIIEKPWDMKVNLE